MQIPSIQEKRAALRQQLASDRFIVAPAVHDIFSLRLIERAGYRSACISGAMLSYNQLGLADMGMVTLTESVDHCRMLTRTALIPITADADAGYGNARGVYHATQLFEEAGAAGINIEDQIVPRRMGAHGKEVVSVREMVAKLRAADQARRDSNFMLIARMDGFGVVSLDEVIARAQAYEAAGADMLLAIHPPSPEDIERLVRAVDIPVSLSAGTGLGAIAACAGLTLKEIADLGVRRVSLTTLLPHASLNGMRAGIEALASADSVGTRWQFDGSLMDSLFQPSRQYAFEDELLSGASDADM